ncbi:MAG: T9SS type A sorting domain-containing protein [Bacteroidetes bacterium]|nr:T9SS type A sorting domain-containing protein [Bacteroidota bacterium]
MNRYALCFILSYFVLSIQAQNYPWQRPLKIATSADGKIFNTPAIYQDSSGVPSVVQWHGDTLVCAFQWFRQPMNSPTWDRVAVKFSYDAGLTWTQPVPIVIPDIPTNYQRPFDPTLAVINADSIRIYFSSSNGLPKGGLDSLVNTYSAVSKDGIQFNFEPNPRFDHPTRPVIDPAVLQFKNEWHYTAPAGAPQDGAFHATGSNGIQFTQQATITSDNAHNWTGNLMLENNSEMRFYGSGQLIWYNATSDGTSWQGFVNTNLNGGDPSIIKISANKYIAIYVGETYNLNINFTCGDTFLDMRDNRKYTTVKIGNQCWMKQNLTYGVFVQSNNTGVPHADVTNNMIFEKYCYNNNINTSNQYGGYYDWNELMNYKNAPSSQGLCPMGWHVPSLTEFQVLIDHATSSSNALKIVGEGNAPNGIGNDSTGFSAKHTGDRGSLGDFNGANLVSTFWTSTETAPDMARHIYMIADDDSIKIWTTQKSSGFACRCLNNTLVPTNLSNPNKSTIQIYPNPFQGNLHINIPLKQVEYTLFNSIGQNIWSGEEIENIDFSWLREGIYILNIAGDELNYSIKLRKD